MKIGKTPRFKLNLAASEGIEPPTPSLGQNASLGSTRPPFPVDTCNFRAFWQDRRGKFPRGFPN